MDRAVRACNVHTLLLTSDGVYGTEYDNSSFTDTQYTTKKLKVDIWTSVLACRHYSSCRGFLTLTWREAPFGFRFRNWVIRN